MNLIIGWDQGPWNVTGTVRYVSDYQAITYEGAVCRTAVASRRWTGAQLPRLVVHDAGPVGLVQGLQELGDLRLGHQRVQPDRAVQSRRPRTVNVNYNYNYAASGATGTHVQPGRAVHVQVTQSDKPVRCDAAPARSGSGAARTERMPAGSNAAVPVCLQRQIPDRSPSGRISTSGGRIVKFQRRKIALVVARVIGVGGAAMLAGRAGPRAGHQGQRDRYQHQARRHRDRGADRDDHARGHPGNPASRRSPRSSARSPPTATARSPTRWSGFGFPAAAPACRCAASARTTRSCCSTAGASRTTAWPTTATTRSSTSTRFRSTRSTGSRS